MKNIVENNYGEVTVVRNSDYEWGVVDNEENIIVPFGKYGWIDGFDNGLARVRTNKKLGLSNNPPVCIITPNNKLILGTENIKAYIEKDKKEHPDNYAKWGIINERVKKSCRANMMRYGVFMAKIVTPRELSKMALQEKSISTTLIRHCLSGA